MACEIPIKDPTMPDLGLELGQLGIGKGHADFENLEDAALIGFRGATAPRTLLDVWFTGNDDRKRRSPDRNGEVRFEMDSD